jgi:3-(3-hydroxy-phenyl)propionate hydroxylase
MEEFDVVVVGYGPTGQAAASLLARLGHRVCVFERWPSLYAFPRLCGIDGEAARIVQAAGDVDRALAESTERRHYNLVNGEGEMLVQINWTEDTRVCGFYDRISIYQPDIEDAIDDAARERGAVINQGWEVKDFEQDEDGVTVTAAQRRRGYEGGTPEPPRTVRAKYLFASDGARSKIREKLGAEREDLGFSDAFLSVDVERKREIDIPADTTLTVCDPMRNVTVVPIGAKRIRFEFLIDPDEDNTELLTPDVGYDFLASNWGLTRDDVEIYRQVIYPFEGKVAWEWRHGRVLLGGDAAHLMPPFAGQGACAGLRDAMNAAWKLDLVLNGVSDDSLLDSYTVERRPHVRTYTVGGIELANIACIRDPEKAAERDEAFRNGGGLPRPEIPLVDSGILHRGEDGQPAAPAGAISPQGRIRLGDDEGRFDDVVGWGFVLISRAGDPLAALSDSQRELLETLRCAAVAFGDGPGEASDLEGEYGPWLEGLGVEAVLIRPDFTVFGGVEEIDELPALVDDLRAQLGVRELQHGA